MSYNFDLFIIGAGPGGIAAAKQAANYGKRVAIAEQEAIGGTCVNRGCVPKKLIVYAADIALQDKIAPSYGWSECQRHFNWSKFIAKVYQHVESIQKSYLETLQKNGVELIRQRATFIDPHTVEIGNRKITADKILIAVGGHPNKPDIPGIEHAITSREMFQLQQLPQKLAIVGGGYIGIEFASMMNAFGVEVTLMDTNELILDGFDNDIRSSVQKGLIQRGIQFLSKTTVKEIKQSTQGLQLTLSGDTEETITADTILVATGRVPNTKHLGLENAGVELGEKGAIQVDDYNRTTQDNIFAVGDCISRVPLTPVARTEGEAVAKTAFGDNPQQINYDYVTSAVFARPEAATVGMTEEEAREKYNAVQCYQTEFEPLLYSIVEQKEPTTMKLVVDSPTDRVLGAHMVGERAADIIQSLAVAIRKGITKEDFDATIGIHPTTGEEFLTLD
ncbi:glutathione-disulfide reductase [Gloeocapsopsis dulcis]|uniref:Glutathione-disulfide reductase n=1 Tax=Gloeocapsopsis dulcis AAB1 = 1H9 TaxID=1433147 RepID=A0A6N8FTG6_9CHRO|nr:glutathione-disulfide reductase [Gloeocapsopsis dulcis]MUL36398.1 glutathione-disulfide reductase [Gloeocapsopsis dulcis AAB1 = 1H9]WNN88107.1 glutathione-disulfide reductase [Gloeocapsopsis dulcis]